MQSLSICYHLLNMHLLSLSLLLTAPLAFVQADAVANQARAASCSASDISLIKSSVANAVYFCDFFVSAYEPR